MYISGDNKKYLLKKSIKKGTIWFAMKHEGPKECFLKQNVSSMVQIIKILQLY